MTSLITPTLITPRERIDVAGHRGMAGRAIGRALQLAASPEQPAGKRLQGGIEAHQGEPGQFSLGSQQAIEGIAMGHRVAAGMQTMAQADRQEFETLSCNQLVEIIEQQRWQP